MKKILSSFYVISLIVLTVFAMSCSDNTSNPPVDTSPKIDSISPSQGYVGTTVKIYGKNFGDARGNSIIMFGSIIIQESNINEWTANALTVLLPENLPAAEYKVSVTVDGVESNEVDFKVIEKSGTVPVITNMSKTSATTGETIKIYGEHFGNPQTTSWVTFNGVKADSVISWQSTGIFLIIPEGATTGPVVVWVNNIPSNSDKVLEIQSKFQLLTMVNIHSGTFMMGDDNNEEFDNKPAHKVTFSKDFLMSEAEITQKQWMTIMDNSNPSHPNDTGAYKPVQQVTFIRACDFCNRLSKMEGYTPVYTIDGEKVTWNTNANGYRLPTEAEWEYACRAGRKQDYSYDDVANIAWFSDNADGHSHEVKSKPPNDYGLYDILGNVAEWCWDLYDSDYYKNSPEFDPKGPATSDFNDRITRGGSWVNGITKVNSTIRNSIPGTNDNFSYDLGFRVVRNK